MLSGSSLRAAAIEHRRQIGAAAEPGFAGDDKARVHVHRRHVRIVRMRDQRNAGGPEARIVGGAGDLLAEFRRELAMHGRAMHADLLEHAAAHQRHHAAAANRSRPSVMSGRCGSQGVRTKRPALRSAERRLGGQGVFQRLEPRRCRRAAPRTRRGRGSCGLRSGGVHRRLIGQMLSRTRANSQAARLPQRLAGHHGHGHRDIERAQAFAHRDAKAGVGGLMHGLRHAGAFAAEQQHLVVPEGVVEV